MPCSQLERFAVLAHGMQPLRLAPGIEAVLLVVLTASLGFGAFDVLRRVRFLRPPFGLAPAASEGTPGPAAAALTGHAHAGKCTQLAGRA